MSTDQPSTVGDAHPFNQVSAEYDLEFDTRRFEYLVQRRDALLDRIRFGALTLNGASLVGLFAALGGDGRAATWLGFNPQVALWSAGLFVGGVASAGIAILMEAKRCTEEAGNASVRRQSASLFRASFAQRFNREAQESTERLMKGYHQAPQIDFGFSIGAFRAQALSTSCWFTGIAIPLVNSAGLVTGL